MKKYVLMCLFTGSMTAHSQNAIVYSHHTSEKAEQEILFMSDFGEYADGSRYMANMLEYELGITDRWTFEFKPEGYIKGQGSAWRFSGFRIENRWRLLDMRRFLNPVLYVEYEDVGRDSPFILDIAGREDGEGGTQELRSRKREVETRLILGRDLMDEKLLIHFNWINETDLDHGETEFGYALGLTYHLTEGSESVHAVSAGLEFYGGLGNSDKGITADPALTQQYIAANIKLHISPSVAIRFGGHIGLTDQSQDIFKTALGYSF